MTVTIQPLDEQATDDQAPGDAWLDQTLLAQGQALLNAPRTCSGSFVLSPLLIYDRVLDDFTSIQAHFSAVPAVFAVVPVRLPIGATSINIRLTCDQWVNGSEAGNGVRVGASLLGETGFTPRLTDLVNTDFNARDVSLVVAFDALTLERADTLFLWMMSNPNSAPWEDGGVAGRTFSSFDMSFGGIENVGFFVGPDDMLRPLIFDDESPPPSQGYEIQNAIDNQISNGFYRRFTYYGSPQGSYVAQWQVRSLHGLIPRAMTITITAPPAARPRSTYRANIPITGASHALLRTLAKQAQDYPRPLMILPLGDITGTSGKSKESEPRKWRLANGADRRLVSSSIHVDRPYGALEIQLRLIGVDGAATTAEAPDYASPESELEAIPIVVELYPLTTSDPISTTPISSNQTGDLKVWRARSTSVQGRALNDLGRYAEGRIQDRLRDEPQYLSGPGYRDGLLTSQELALLSTVVLRVPIDPAMPVDRPQGLQIRIADDPFWEDNPDLFIAVVGCSVTWDGR